MPIKFFTLNIFNPTDKREAEEHRKLLEENLKKALPWASITVTYKGEHK
jgi:hypothetical protein